MAARAPPTPSSASTSSSTTARTSSSSPLGTNDARTTALRGRQPLLSPTKTRRNLALLHDLGRRSGARCNWLTPPPVDDEAGSVGGDRWTPTAVAAVADAVRDLDTAVVDLQRRDLIDPSFRRVVSAAGVHLTPSSHTLVLREVLRTITA